jgi:hypothetical protein
MSDPFNILGPEFEEAPAFDEAVRTAVADFQVAAERFRVLCEQVSEELLTDHEWRIVEKAAEELEAAIERADEGYVAVQYDSHAWYRIMESLQRIRLRLDSASGILELARDRTGRSDGATE